MIEGGWRDEEEEEGNRSKSNALAERPIIGRIDLYVNACNFEACPVTESAGHRVEAKRDREKRHHLVWCLVDLVLAIDRRGEEKEEKEDNNNNNSKATTVQQRSDTTDLARTIG
ncbi:hypothetical protein M0804_007382 [Polistes exclamans]|nr:hypothetical protein M0804_007382 [Polistes exclamans]